MGQSEPSESDEPRIMNLFQVYAASTVEPEFYDTVEDPDVFFDCEAPPKRSGQLLNPREQRVARMMDIGSQRPYSEFTPVSMETTVFPDLDDFPIHEPEPKVRKLAPEFDARSGASYLGSFASQYHDQTNIAYPHGNFRRCYDFTTVICGRLFRLIAYLLLMIS